MKRRALVSLLVVLVALSATGVASATTMRALDVASLSNEADAVVVGRVISVSDVVRVSDGRLVPRTITRVAVDELVAGEPTPDVVRIVENEGTVGPLRIVRDTALELRRGQRVLLFLAAHEGAYRTVGVTQGAYVVHSDRLTSETTVSRSSEPGLLLGSTKALGIDLDATPSLEAMRRAVGEARAGR